MKLSRELWLQVEPLFTSSLEMEASARATWLAGLEKSHPEAAPVLRRMLEKHERAELSGELETVQMLAPLSRCGRSHSAGERIGPFELVRLLGRGGMGEVWLARQVDGRIERDVALKLPALNQEGDVWQERFRRERDFLARLEHPHIARLYDAGVSDCASAGSSTMTAQPWLAMEFVEGLSLSEFVASRSLSIAQRLVLFRQVLAAVAHAHRHLVVHRDLKPANILIDASGQVKLLDFGIAKLVDEGDAAGASGDLTRIGGRVMTLRYAAPEQVATGIITTATDIYSLGVILHELVTGLSPYRAVRDGKPLTDVMLLQEETAVPSKLALTMATARGCGLVSSSQLARLVSGDLDAIVLKAMRRDPADRYASGELFDEDILACLERRPVKARAGTWRYLAGRFASRHKVPLAMVAAVIVTIAAALVVVDLERREAVAEKARAERHFASVRKLANAFIFDVHGEIENLAGSLKAREMLIRTSLAYLDALVGEAGDDPALMVELAAAFRKIGDIQGQASGANTGDLRLAIVNYEKAKRLFVALDRARPDDIEAVREHASLSRALARSYVLTGDPRWQGEIAAAVGLAQRVAALPGASPDDRAGAASTMAQQAIFTSAVIGQSADVEATAVKAVSILEALVGEMPGQLGVRANLIATYRSAAGILTGNNRTAQSMRRAVEYYRKALEMLEGVLAEHPDDERMRTTQVRTLVGLATTLSLVGDHREAERTIIDAVRRGAELQARDQTNTELGVVRLEVLTQAALIAHRLGNQLQSIRYGHEALALAARLPADRRNSRDVRNEIALSKSYLGYAQLALAETASLDQGTRLALLREARTLLSDGVAFVAEARAEKLGPVIESEVKELEDALARCDRALARLGTAR